MILLFTGIIFGIFFIKFWFGKYFAVPDGGHIDITKNIDAVDDWVKNLSPSIAPPSMS